MTSGLHRSGPKGRRPGLGLLKDRRDNRGGRNTGSRRRSWRSSNGIFRGYWNCRRIRFWRHGSNGRSDLSLSEVLAGRCRRTGSGERPRGAGGLCFGGRSPPGPVSDGGGMWQGAPRGAMVRRWPTAGGRTLDSGLHPDAKIVRRMIIWSLFLGCLMEFWEPELLLWASR